jgi:Spx/MgsR family transcriptional regulator
MKTTLFGIANCDSVKKAQRWLSENEIPYSFHDYRKDGLDEALLRSFLGKLTWTDLLNKRSTSYRQLTERQKVSLNAETVIPLFIATPTLIKRPLLVHNSDYQLGFKAENYKKLFSL